MPPRVFVNLFFSFRLSASAGVSPGTGPNRGGRTDAAGADADGASMNVDLRAFFQGGVGGVGGDFGSCTVGVAGLGGQAGVGGGGCTAPRTPTRFAQIASNEDAFAISGGVRTCAAAIGCDIGCDQEAQLAASDSSNAL